VAGRRSSGEEERWSRGWGDVPPGVAGLRASGKLSRDDYRETLEPGVTNAVDSGEARHLFAWAMPGELGVYGLGELEEAKAWVAG
jgi:hypothetical protein